MLTKQEIGRKGVHILVGLIVVSLIYFNILSSLAMFLIIIIGVIASILSKRIKLPIINCCLDYFEREEIKKTFPGKGMIYFFVGSLLAVQLFEKDIALAAIMILTFGDSVSHLIGQKWGKIKNLFNGESKKLFEGTLAGTVAGALGAALFIPVPEAIIASFGAMAAEVIQIDLNSHSVDDNLIIPLVAGTIIFLLRMYI